MLGDGRELREGEAGAHRYGCNRDRRTNQGMTGNCDQAKVNKGGGVAQSWDTATDSVTWSGVNIRATEASRWWVRAAYRWIAL